MNELIIPAIFGAIGGSARTCLGILKSRRFYNSGIDPARIAASFLFSGLLGVFSALLFAESIQISLLAGYAGIDIAEGVSKIIRKRISVLAV